MAQHGLEDHSHGAGVPVQIRHARHKSTSVEDYEKPTKFEEVWKYFPLDKLAGLDEAVYAELEQGHFGIELNQGASAELVDSTDELVGSAGTPEDRVSAAAWTNASKTLKVILSGESSEPHYIRITADEKPRAAHIVVHAEPNSQATLVLDHQGHGKLAENVEIIVGQGANLSLITIQDWDASSIHVSNHFAKLEKDSNLKHVVVSMEGEAIRIVPQADLSAPGSNVEMYGVYLADSHQFIEHRPFVDHNAASCRSRVTYKGALQGKGAHTVWIGDVLIREAGVGTDTYELNRNLLLTDGARADSVPNLEIETGKIEGAGHASASGRFDDEQLFYLQSRGLDEHTARRLVVRGFLNEVIQQIGVEEIQDRLTTAIEADLERVV
ncbi:MAG: Fe-S cluster assembly protein SufD [Microbacteriaceae bacterium]|nr:Fe-S cluster assembly protein SufD [Microbacteriaceae bacterium]MDR9443427.1 Fe-S cluster assembly protein SufD [Microbacteriaceae bacterium]